jgi:DnaJ homolog subfamily A member 5
VPCQIDALDVESAGASTHAAPVLGNSTTPIDDVNAFYRHWMSYISQRSFAWVDEYKTTDAPTRLIRRAMEKENKKLRDVAKKAFTSDVRAIVDFVRKRDPRMAAFQKQKDKDRQLQLERDEQKKREKQAAYEAQRQAFQQQERERWENGHEQQQPTSRLAEDDIQAELERLRKKLDAELLLCELCNKTFKSDKQLHNHLTSKKHKDRELELGIVSEFDSVEDALDQELLAELAELKRAKQQVAEEEQAKARKEQAPAEDNVASATLVDDAAEAAEAARREKERVRLEKEEKAAEKRRERKDARKSKKKEEVEKIVSAAKKKEAAADSDEEDGRRGKGSRGKKKR